MVWGNFYDSTRININIGDYLQFITVNYIYQHMGISEKDITYIDFADVTEYNGERMILPINNSIHDFVRNGRIAISKQITPVFIALQLDIVDNSINIDEFLSDEYNQQYFLKHSPIGCRDIVTYQYLKKYGIPSYVNGCMTATLPTYSGERGDKIILADVPTALLPYIPDSLLKQSCEATTQQYHFTEQEVKDYQSIYAFVKSRYGYYCKNAKLIITSRLHVALPCTAFGIPVILAKDYVDTRFDFVEHYIPVYDRKQYERINWTPEAPNYEPFKQQLIDFAVKRIRYTRDCLQQEQLFTSVFVNETYEIEKYSNPHNVFHKNDYRFRDWAENYWNTDSKSYALWGVNADRVLYWKELIQSKYPEASLIAIYDKYKKGDILGIELQNPDEIKNLPDETVVIVCAVGATIEAKQLFQRLGWQQNRYCITADCFIAQEDL